MIRSISVDAVLSIRHPVMFLNQKASLTAELQDERWSYLSAPGTGSPTIVINSCGIIPACRGRSCGIICKKKHIYLKITTIHSPCSIQKLSLKKKNSIMTKYDSLCLLSKSRQIATVYPVYNLPRGRSRIADILSPIL